MKRKVISLAVTQTLNLGKSRYSFRLRQEPRKVNVYTTHPHPIKSGNRCGACGFIFFNGKLINV